MKPINPLHRHYAFENPGTVYDEDALTALELCARTAKKTNECVGAFNTHLMECEKENNDHEGKVTEAIKEQNKVIAGAVDFMKDNIDTSVDVLLAQMAEAGELEGVLQSKYFVTPQMFGAKGDGETDDTEAFQTAFDSAERVFIPAGTYVVGTLEPKACEVIGAKGAKLLLDGSINYEGVYYPRLRNITIESMSDRTCILLRDSYYGVFDSITFTGVLKGVYLDGTGDDNGVYYHRFSNCVFDSFEIGIHFKGVANAHTVEKCVFYKCETGIYNDGGENIIIRDNTFQSFTRCGVRFEQTGKGHTISSVVMGNYFEADATATTMGDIYLGDSENVTGNFIFANHYTYTSANHHVTGMVAQNMVLDYYNKQEANTPNTLMGFTAHEVVPSEYLSYGGERYLGTLAPVETQDGMDINLHLYGRAGGSNGWKRVLTTGLSEDDTVTLPPISSQSINQYYGGYIKLGYDYSGTEDKAITFDTNHGVIKMYNGDAWEFYQKVDSGTTANRPTWKPRGYMYYDTTLGKPIWSTGSNTWVDATGATV